ncbi:MAG TPA: hypothetical protein VF310_02295 [Vicinamibacteria bacterium]
MSLILEALKKLERDKETPDRGFLVMTQMPWVGEGRRRRVVLLALAVVAIAAVALLARWILRRPAAAPPAEAAVTAPATVASAPAAAPERQVVPDLPPPRAAAADAAPALPRYLPPTQRPAFPVSPRAAAPAAAAPAAGAPPALAPAAAADALRLEAVSEQDGVAVAVVNGQLVREGDRIGEATVIKISGQAVEIEVNGRRSTLRF